jgi:hypothetical protein
VLRKAYLNAMKGLENGLSVRDIAVFGLADCLPEERVGSVQQRVALHDFDNVPVREADARADAGEVVGVVENIKGHPPAALVRDVMTPLSESMLVAGALSLVRFLPRIADREYRLVVEEHRIVGVVTPSDVVQLPVRLLVFASLIHLEETMANVLRWATNDDQQRMLDALRADRRGIVRRLLARQAAADLNPQPIDAMFFGDKADLLFDLGVLDDSEHDRALFRAFRDLRNRVDHAQSYAETRAELDEFLGHVEQLRVWIDRLTRMLPAEVVALSGDEPDDAAA